MNVEIVQEAKVELEEAIDYYEELEQGLGIRFKEEARHAIQWIRDNPLMPRVRTKGYRRVNLKVFPFYVAYFIRAGSIWVWRLLMADGARNTGSKERKKSIEKVSSRI